MIKFLPYALAVIALSSSIHDVHAWSSVPITFAKSIQHKSSFATSDNNLLQRTSLLPSVSSLFSTRKSDNEDLQQLLPSMGLNELQTQFRLAIGRQDMDAATLYRDELAERVSSGAYRPNNEDGEEESNETKRARLSWAGLGTAPWLIERLDALEYPLPTTIQINAFEAVNSILLNQVTLTGLSVDARVKDDDTLEERMQSQSPQNMGVVISGSTGSGKTLAYLVPALSTLSQTLFTRERIRIKAEEDVGDIMGDLLDRVMVQASPSVRGQGYNQVGGKSGRSAIASGAALSSLGKSGTDVKSPVCLIVVPTRELGVQIALTMFQLVGGNVKKSATERSGRKNMFKYKGPKGVKIGCVLDEDVAKEGLKLQTDVAITTPHYLTKLIEEGDVDPSKLRVVIYDEADLGLEQTSNEDLKLLFDNSDNAREFSRVSYLVGATVTESLGNLAVKDEILPEGKSFIATATRFAPLTKETEKLEAEEESSESTPFLASLKDLNLCLDPGLRHERVMTPDNTGLLCLTRMLRKELRDYELRTSESDEEETAELSEMEKLRQETNEFLEEDVSSSVFASSNAANITKTQRPRVVVFFPDEVDARDAILSLRDAMWGEHKLGVLLPDTGAAPLSIMEQFKKGDLTVLLATPNSIRGLDFPALTHVYTLFLPADDPREYLHLAGRVGRIGQQGSVRGQGGRVTTILDPEDASKYDEMASFLGFDFVDVEPLQAEVTQESDVEAMRRYLEDTITLLGTADEPKVNYSEVESQEYVDDDDDDEEED
jgi:superfamily II DNA/RNA helicase